MATARVLVVAEKEGLRIRLQALVAELPGFQVVGACCCGPDALRQIRTRKPSLVLIDGDAPQGNCLRVVEQVQEAGSQRESLLPVFVLVTASEGEAARAFELGVVDYILKPFTDERLHAALERIQRRFFKDAESTPRKAALGSSEHSVPAAKEVSYQPDRLALKQGKSTVLVELNRIDWVEASDVYLQFHVGEKTYLVRERLKHVEQRLSTRGFMRIHRSVVVNLDRVREVMSEPRGGGQVVLASGVKLKMSRSYSKQVEALLEPLQLG